MNIFLDTNVFYNDPFLQKGKKPILLQLAKHENVKLFICQAVFSEIEKHHKTFFEEEIKSIKDSFSKMESYLKPERDTFGMNIEVENLLGDFTTYFDGLTEEGQMTIIPYDVDVFNHVMEVDMYDRMPFIKQEEITNKKGDKVLYKKKEIRDTIIWYSYQEYIKKHQIEYCYFISNNTKEFSAEPGRRTPQEEPYPLHPAIVEDSKMLAAYKNVHDFLAHNSDKVKELFTNLHAQILSEELYNQVWGELEEGLAEELVTRFLEKEILQETHNYLSERDTDDIHEEYYMGGQVAPTLFGEIKDIEFQEATVYDKAISVLVELEVETEVEISLYDAGYADRSEKYRYYGTDTLNIKEKVVFLIPLNEEKEIDKDNFSLRDYVEGVTPGNVNVEIIEMENIGHMDMFPELDYGLDY
ncbi:PIN domain-containing protein [Priestia megaterium]|uniref:PIN domain-containing protein n=1 Tax=Priestia megaterium TaxID=1404 RepID=UPI002452F240|nr:PIN domain-containing protein [Priestia megaterium]MDH3183540.1 PIN domain-containing protein [Priestia megaterium]MDH3183580.1 PIN domain-containing protein [Priestia megaterium]